MKIIENKLDKNRYIHNIPLNKNIYLRNYNNMVIKEKDCINFIYFPYLDFCICIMIKKYS